MVASPEASATMLGLEILKQGGNAIDAAVAIGYMLAVTHPRAGNIGGGGFMLIYLAKQQQSIAIDYRETAPEATNREDYLNEQGCLSITVHAHGLPVGVFYHDGA